MSDWAKYFESIGDNCEFGFMQQQRGVDEGSLLKWCRILSHEDLINLLNSPQEDFYKKENLVPIYDDMLIDKNSKILYHTVLYSRETDGVRNFVESGESFDITYEAEFQKKTYMYEKFFSGLRNGNKAYIYKENSKNDINIARKISDCLKNFNANNKLLYVTDLNPDDLVIVEKIDDNLYRGFIKAFAPYYPVTDAKLEYWDDMCQLAIKMMESHQN